MAAEHSTTSRGNNWSDDEISLLISVWADESIQRMLNGTCRDSLVYKKIAEKALQRGLNRTADQCHRKLKALKLKYKEVVDSNRRSGRGRISMPFFEELSQILGNRPSVNPGRNTVMESLSIGHHSDEDSNGSDDSSQISPDQATAQDKSDGTSTIATDVNDSRVTTPIGMPLKKKKKRPRRVLTDVEENISPDRGEEPEDAETCERPSPQDDPDDTASAVVKRRTMRIKKKEERENKMQRGLNSVMEKYFTFEQQREKKREQRQAELMQKQLELEERRQTLEERRLRMEEQQQRQDSMLYEAFFGFLGQMKRPEVTQPQDFQRPHNFPTYQRPPVVPTFSNTTTGKSSGTAFLFCICSCRTRYPQYMSQRTWSIAAYQFIYKFNAYQQWF
ncbi:uncharacterized protein [Ptychodera flava]|uniref:uncharacterized protein n=1 Tax=Ptychodera flava TaxID=63121 RepID=UPI00396AA95A